MLVVALIKRQMLRKALQLLKAMQGDGIFDPIVDKLLILALIQQGDVDSARLIANNMKAPDAMVYRLMISAYHKVNKKDEAEEMRRLMEEHAKTRHKSLNWFPENY